MYGNGIWDHDLAQDIRGRNRAFLFAHFRHRDGWFANGDFRLGWCALVFLHRDKRKRQDGVFSFKNRDI